MSSNDSARRWALRSALILVVAAVAVHQRLDGVGAASAVAVDGAVLHQRIDGFGGSDAFHVGGYINGYGSTLTAAQTDQILDLLFSTTSGAGLSIVRHQIGSSTAMLTGVPPTGDGDNMPSHEPFDPGGPNAAPQYVWNNDDPDRGQVWLSQRAQAYGVETFIADAWSAPHYMKTNNALVNGGYLCGAIGQACASGDWRQHYANYLVQFVRFYDQYGIRIKYLGFNNEPELSPSYTGMNWDATSVAGSRGVIDPLTPQTVDFIKNYLGPTLAASGFDTQVACCEATSWANTALYTNGILADPGSRAHVGLVTGHAYYSSPNGIAGAPILSAELHGKPVWQTEVSVFDALTTAWDDGGQGSGFTWAGHLHTALTAGRVNAYLYWWLATLGTNNEAFINISGSTFTVSKRLWAFAGYSRYVRPGAMRISATTANTNLKVTAFRNTDGSYVAVALNAAAADEVVTFSLANVSTAGTATPYLTNQANSMAPQPALSISGGAFTGTVPARSLVTYRIAAGPQTPTPPPTPRPTPTPIPPGPIYQQSTTGDRIVAIEAENFNASTTQSAHSWISTTTPMGFGGTGAMESTPNNNLAVVTDYFTNSPRLDFNVNFTTIGTHYVWVRGAAAGGGDDSVHAGLDNIPTDTSDNIGSFGGAWTWSRQPQDGGTMATILVPTLGVHTVNLWMREDGFKADRIVLTTNVNFTPADLGPVESPRTGATPTPTARVTPTPTATPTTRPTVTPTPTPTATPTIRPTLTPTSTPTATPTTRPTATPTTRPTPTPSGSVVLQSESGTVGGGTTIDSNHAGFNGTGFANFPASGGFLQWSNVAGTGASATLRFRYALGASGSRTGQLLINGVAQNIAFASTGGWTTWVTQDVAAVLTAGTGNTVRLQSNGQDLGNVDQVEVLTSGTPRPSPTPTVTPVCDPLAGASLTTFTAQAGNAQVALSFATSGGPVSGVRIHRSQVAGGPYTTIATVPNPSPTSPTTPYSGTFLDTTVTNGVTYFYVANTYSSYPCNPPTVTFDGMRSAEVSATPVGATPTATPTATLRPTATPTARVTATPTATPTATATATPTPTGGLTTQVAIGDDWGAGYCATLTVFNGTTQAVTWVVTLPVEGTVTNMWNGTFTQSGNQLTVRGIDWNGVLPAGGSTSSIGFCADR